jgi:hypothetical protein
MAQNRQGISGFLPFPTFQGGEGTGGITQVKLGATPMRFPTTNYRAPRRTAEPTTKETLAPFAPLALEGLFGLFSDDEEKLSSADYLTSIGGMVEEPTTLADVRNNSRQQARLDTYNLYGDAQEKDGFGLSEIANIVLGSQMGRGADEYAQTYFKLRGAKETARQQANRDRTTFLTSQLAPSDNLTYQTFEDTESAQRGVPTYRSGFVSPSGEIYIQELTSPNKKEYVNVRELQGNWIKRVGRTDKTVTDELSNPFYKSLVEADAQIIDRDNAISSTINLTNKVVDLLDAGIADDKDNPLTAVTALASVADGALQNVNAALAMVGGGDANLAFATTRNRNLSLGGSNGREGSGELSQGLYNAILTGDDNRITAAMEAFEQGGALGNDRGGNPRTFEDLLGRMSYNNVRTRSVMLQLAYQAAAANGQTGRTLSDKDLAYHLDMVGFGTTSNAQTAKDNLLNFMDTLIGSSDDGIKTTISRNQMNTSKYNLKDGAFTGIINGYWEPPEIEIDDPDNKGKKIKVKDFSTPNEYKFKNYWTRYKDNESTQLMLRHLESRTRREGRSSYNPDQINFIRTTPSIGGGGMQSDAQKARDDAELLELQRVLGGNE